MAKTVIALMVAMVLAGPARAEVSSEPTEHAQPGTTNVAADANAGAARDADQQTGSALSAQESASIKDLVTAVAEEHGVPPAMAHAIVAVESRYDCAAKNPRSSATGLMQTLRGTARAVGVTGDLQDCRTGLEAGMRYLKRAVEAHGSGCAAASAYNTGLSGKRGCTLYGRKAMALIDRSGAGVP
jgi:soluble lytic murein transglycosylase-like protein